WHRVTNGSYATSLPDTFGQLGNRPRQVQRQQVAATGGLHATCKGATTRLQIGFTHGLVTNQHAKQHQITLPAIEIARESTVERHFMLSALDSGQQPIEQLEKGGKVTGERIQLVRHTAATAHDLRRRL